MNTRRIRHSEEITSPKPYADVGKGRVAVNTIAKTSVKGQDEVKETEAKQDSTPKKKKTETIRSVLRVGLDLEDEKPMKKGVRSVKKRKVQQDSAAVESQTQRPDDRVKAKDFPPGLATTISCGLFDSKEPQTVANLLQKMLCVQNMVPPLHLVEKLMDLLKYGPKAEGSSVYFKDPLRTELASSYAYALVEASSRLVRKDDSALFGPSSWDDVEVLLSQSIDQTENAMSGRRLAQGLHMAACGAKLLCLMLKTELLKRDFSSSANFSFGTLSMKLMPTVKVLKTKGLRNALKAVVRHTTKCLVRHSKWILDHDLNELDSRERASAECCAAEAKACFDCLGSVLCYTAWLYCAEEGIEIKRPNCAFVVKDAFLTELMLCTGNENLPKTRVHIEKVKLYFILSFVEEFAFPLQDSVGRMIGLEALLDCDEVEPTAKAQICDDVSDGNIASSCPSQFARKRSIDIDSSTCSLKKQHVTGSAPSFDVSSPVPGTANGQPICARSLQLNGRQINKLLQCPHLNRIGATQQHGESQLNMICKRFVDHCNGLRQGTEVNILMFAEQLGVDQRRIYELINILESIEIVARKGKSTVLWHGTGMLPNFFAQLQRDDEMDEQSRKLNGTWVENPNKPKVKVMASTCQKLLQIFLTTGKTDFTLAYAADVIMGPAAEAAEEAAKAAFAASVHNPIPLPDPLAPPALPAIIGGQQMAVATVVPSGAAVKSSNATDQKAMKTKVRRMYDIANVLQALGIIEKYNVGSTSTENKPSLRWVFFLSPEEISQYAQSGGGEATI